MEDSKRQQSGEGACGKRKSRDLGRKDFNRQSLDKRARNEKAQAAKRRKLEQGEEVTTPIYATNFSQEDIENEQRRPKKKAAVLLGYSGTGYHGMQLSATERTIEGDLFPALVAAGAISKANAADPKKSSFVRCARTDKGVHAAGNVVSLKMIVEDPDLVKKINEQLSPQIRVWDVLVASKSFSSYMMCDSRVYEYLIPSHSFLPPHPSTYLGRKLVEVAEQCGDLDGFKARQEEVDGFWNEVDEKYIKPILEEVPDETRRIVQKALYIEEEENAMSVGEEPREPKARAEQKNTEPKTENPVEDAENTETDKPTLESDTKESDTKPNNVDPGKWQIIRTVKAIKAAYLDAKRAYRIPAARMARIQETLDKFVGTRNFYNYTIQKAHNDPSARRVIRSFKLNPSPIIIDGTEWLSLKVHGQSFMMHQIRKMVSMMALIVRCGCDPQRIVDSYGPTKIAIPKVPGLGLLLEHPVFDTYNKKAQSLGKEKIEFDRYSKEIDEFKQREIYDRIFREEEETKSFASFFNHVDNLPKDTFLYISSGGVQAAASSQQPNASLSDEQKQSPAAVQSDSGSGPEENKERKGEEEG